MHELNIYHLLDYSFKLIFFSRSFIFVKLLSYFNIVSTTCLNFHCIYTYYKSINIYCIHVYLINYSIQLLFIVATHVKSNVTLTVYSSLTQLICQLFRICFMRLHSTLADTAPWNKLVEQYCISSA